MLDPRAILHDEHRKIARGRRAEDITAKTLLDQKRRQTGVVVVRVGEHQRIDRLRVRDATAILRFSLATLTLKRSAVDQQASVIDLQQVL